jgi:hypothetical protein
MVLLYAALLLVVAILWLENGASHTRPSVAQESEVVCLVKVPADLADQLVCAASEVDAVMGPMPSVPRVKTGFAPFDHRYALFGGPAPWAKRALVERFLELGLRWLRVREGRCEIAFPPLATEDLPRAIALAATVARLPSGAGSLPRPALPRLYALRGFRLHAARPRIHHGAATPRLIRQTFSSSPLRVPHSHIGRCS